MRDTYPSSLSPVDDTKSATLYYHCNGNGAIDGKKCGSWCIGHQIGIKGLTLDNIIRIRRYLMEEYDTCGWEEMESPIRKRNPKLWKALQQLLNDVETNPKCSFAVDDVDEEEWRYK